MAKRKVGSQNANLIKVMNRFDLFVCRWHATYHWNFFNKGYNFALNLISIWGLYKKLWTFKVTRDPISRISRLPTWESLDTMTFGCRPCDEAQEYYKGEGGGFPQVRAVVNLVNLCLFVVHSCTKSAPITH